MEYARQGDRMILFGNSDPWNLRRKSVMADMAPQNKRTKPKQKLDPDKLDPKELPQGDTTSSIGEKNIVGIQGRVGEEGSVDVEEDEPKPFVR